MKNFLLLVLSFSLFAFLAGCTAEYSSAQLDALNSPTTREVPASTLAVGEIVYGIFEKDGVVSITITKAEDSATVTKINEVTLLISQLKQMAVTDKEIEEPYDLTGTVNYATESQQFYVKGDYIKVYEQVYEKAVVVANLNDYYEMNSIKVITDRVKKDRENVENAVSGILISCSPAKQTELTADQLQQVITIFTGDAYQLYDMEPTLHYLLEPGYIFALMTEDGRTVQISLVTKKAIMVYEKTEEDKIVFIGMDGMNYIGPESLWDLALEIDK